MPAPINDRAMKNFEASFIALSRPFVRYRKLLLPPVWKEFLLVYSKHFFSFLRNDFVYISFYHSLQIMCAEHENIPMF